MRFYLGQRQRFRYVFARTKFHWGICDIKDVIDATDERGLDHLQTVDMPANNLCVLFRKRDEVSALS